MPGAAAAQVPAGPLTTTTPFSAPAAPMPTTPAGEPSEVAWPTQDEVKTSSNCREAMAFIASDSCDPEVLLASVQRTCPVLKAASAEEACGEWYGKLIGISEANAELEKKRCVAAAKVMAEVVAHLPYAKPANDEEQALCFKCQVQCKGKSLPKPQTEVSDQRWAPDGSEKHCRP